MKISFKVSATSARMVLIPTREEEDDVLDGVSVALLLLLLDVDNHCLTKASISSSGTFRVCRYVKDSSNCRGVGIFHQLG